MDELKDEKVFEILCICVYLFEKKKCKYACLLRGIIYSIGALVLLFSNLVGIALYIKTYFYQKDGNFQENNFETFGTIIILWLVLIILFLSGRTVGLLIDNALNEKENFCLLK